MIVAPLSSGSAGNAYYVESDGTSILVDAGIGPRETKKRLEQVGRTIEQLRAIVITHEHYDHIRGASAIGRKYGIPIYLTQGTLDASRINREKTQTIVFPNDSVFTIGELNVHARRTLHDAADPACFVIEARDGAEGLARCEAEPVDLVLSDIFMPGLSGWDVAAACRDRFPTVPVGLITAWGDQLDPEELARHRIRFVLTKPFVVDNVLRAVASAL